MKMHLIETEKDPEDWKASPHIYRALKEGVYAACGAGICVNHTTDKPEDVTCVACQRIVKDKAHTQELADARADGRRSIIAKLAYWHDGHNASENSWGRLGMQVDVQDDEAVAKYFYDKISEDAREPLEKEITKLKAKLFDLTQ